MRKIILSLLISASITLVSSSTLWAQSASASGNAVWGALTDRPQNQVQAIAAKLYALGFGSSDRFDWKSDLPDWVTSGDKVSITVAVNQWRVANGISGTTVATPVTADELDKIGDGVAPGKWAAIGFDGAGFIDRTFTSARTWNRPSRQLAERVVIDRCAKQDAKSKRTTACRSNVLVFSGQQCAVLLLRADGTRSPRPGDNNDVMVEPIRPVLKRTPDEANDAVRAICFKSNVEDVRCQARHLVCADGRESF